MSEETKKKILNSRAIKNKKYIHTSLEMETSTHFPMLIKTVQASQGTVLELGSGMFSTPLLHWLLFGTGRKLVTYESYPHYLDFAKKFKTPDHEVIYVKDWDKLMFPDHYSVVFIDHSIPKKKHTRGDDAARFANNADFVVLHDGGDKAHAKYGYQAIYPLFKYRYDWTGNKVNTTVLSNFIDVTTWNSPS